MVDETLRYDFDTVHRQGTRMAHVDALSRAPDQPPNDVETAGLVMKVTATSDDWLLTMQLQDPMLTSLVSVLKKEKISDQETQIRKDYELKDHRLYRRTEEGLRFVVPNSVRWRIVHSCHDDMGHFAADKTIQRIRSHFGFRKFASTLKIT